jgi:GNAT superfamily N-acetyltransferase
MDCEVRRVRPGEGPEYRDIRLRALTDAPGAFGSTYADEASRSDSYWTQAAETRSVGLAAGTFIAESGGQWIGIAAGYRDDGSSGPVHLVSMWVDADFRHLGLGRRLVETVLDWARETGTDQVDLWVTQGNDAATALYERAGFAMSGRTLALPSDPCKDENHMVLSLEKKEI